MAFSHLLYILVLELFASRYLNVPTVQQPQKVLEQVAAIRLECINIPKITHLLQIEEVESCKGFEVTPVRVRKKRIEFLSESFVVNKFNFIKHHVNFSCRNIAMIFLQIKQGDKIEILCHLMNCDKN